MDFLVWASSCVEDTLRPDARMSEEEFDEAEDEEALLSKDAVSPCFSSESMRLPLSPVPFQKARRLGT